VSWLGALCLLAVVSTSFRASSRLFAALIFVHWASAQFVWRVFGDAIYLYVMPRDLALGALAAWFAWQRPTWSRVVIVVCVFCMSIAHVAHWTLYARGVYAGEEYLFVLEALFVTMLAAQGAFLGRPVIRSLRRRVVARRGVPDLVGAKRR
jgi:hypothetical protein